MKLSSNLGGSIQMYLLVPEIMLGGGTWGLPPPGKAYDLNSVGTTLDFMPNRKKINFILC